MSGSAQDNEYLMAKATPTPMDDDGDHYAPHAGADQRQAARDTIAPEAWMSPAEDQGEP
jgi:hypothetical protein